MGPKPNVLWQNEKEKNWVENSWEIRTQVIRKIKVCDGDGGKYDQIFLLKGEILIGLDLNLSGLPIAFPTFCLPHIQNPNPKTGIK